MAAQVTEALTLLTVMIVDDSAINRQLLVTLLRYRGYTTLEAGDGDEALTLINQECPDLLITDIVMPKLNGLELVRRLRSQAVTAQLPVIFYTASFMPSDFGFLTHAFAVTRVLTKPAEPETIFETVDALMENAGTVIMTEPLAERDMQALLDKCLPDPPASADQFEPACQDHPTSDQRSINFDRLKQKIGPAGTCRLLELFVVQAPGDLQKLEFALDGGNAESLAFTAHALRGVLGTLEFNELGSTCAQLEDAARERDWNKAKELFEEFRPAFAGLVVATREELMLSKGGTV